MSSYAERFEMVARLKEIMQSFASGRSVTEEEYLELRGRLYADQAIRRHLPEFVVKYRTLRDFWPYIKSIDPTYAGRRQYLADAFSNLLDMLEEAIVSSSDNGLVRPQVEEEVLPMVKTDLALQGEKVFIVHGRDEHMKEAAARLVLELGLLPIILGEEVDQGRTIIQKFEDHAREAVFALVLLSPDDVGRLASDEALRPRARQNVILELGYFLAKLGPAKVCAIHKGDVEKPSDIDGRLYKPFDAAGMWRLQVAREMKAAGLPVDLNKLT